MKIENAANMSAFKTPNAYGFSGVGVDDLGASEYTLVTVVVDISGSVARYKDKLIACLKTILESCQDDPRAENLLLRVVKFREHVTELFGFRNLSEIGSDEFDTALDDIGGVTALFDGTHTSIDASMTYGSDLMKRGILVNAVNFILTDGYDNASKFGSSEVGKLLKKARLGECVESLLTILIGITEDDKNIQDELKAFEKEAGLDAFVDIGSATRKNLAKLAKFISQSISSQSQSLGQGGPSKILTF